MVKGFSKEGDLWFKEEEKAFCFGVVRLNGKGKKFCVPEALKEKPLLRTEEYPDKVKVTPKGFRSFVLYKIKEGKPDLLSAQKLDGPFVIDRDYMTQCYGVAGVEKDRESELSVFCVKAKPHPPVADVERLDWRAVGNKLYIFWSYRKDPLFSHFVVYKNGKLLGSTTSYMWEDELPSQRVTYTVKAVSVYGVESEGASVTYSP